MKEQKIIKDLKERNIKLKNQYELECIRHNCTSLKLKKYKDTVNKAINFYEIHKEKCVVNRDKNGKLKTDYYLPAHLSHDLLDILKEVSE